MDGFGQAARLFNLPRLKGRQEQANPTPEKTNNGMLSSRRAFGVTKDTVTTAKFAEILKSVSFFERTALFSAYLY
jgi:hypothetical protein